LTDDTEPVLIPQMLWPEHCIQGSAHARLCLGTTAGVSMIIRKGQDRSMDSYSAFFSNYSMSNTGRRKNTGLNGYLNDLEIGRLFICGLARDYCVFYTAEDAIQLGYNVVLLNDLTRSVFPDNDKGTMESFYDLPGDISVVEDHKTIEGS
jgi:nicotinamidase/pyrazinamidase